METFAGLPGMAGGAGSNPLMGLTGPETMAGMPGMSGGKSGSMDPQRMLQQYEMLEKLRKAGTSGARPPGLGGLPTGASGGGGMPGMGGPPSFSHLMDRLVRYKGAV